MSEEPQSVLPSFLILAVIAVAAACVTIARGGIRGDAVALRKTARMAVLTTILQAGHFLEEATTGLNLRLPELFGAAPLTMEFFVTANVVALVIWLVSAWALAQGSSGVLFPLWFLGVACVANAVIHPALSVATGGYFPGLITSPVVGAAGFFLLRGLARITQRSGAVSGES